MTDRPIIFSAPMVRALLDGRKTQTRRLLKPQPPEWCANDRPGFSCLTPVGHIEFRGRWPGNETEEPAYGSKFIRLPAVKGDRLYVRENWRVSPDACEGWHPDELRGWIDYQAGGSIEAVAPSMDAVEAATFLKTEDHDWDCIPSRYRPCIHMPRWASRLTLHVEAVKVERLQEINEADALEEGMITYRFEGLPGHDVNTWHWLGDQEQEDTYTSARAAFRALWASLHAKSGERWEDNPFVVALTFRVERGNIDRLAA